MEIDDDQDALSSLSTQQCRPLDVVLNTDISAQIGTCRVRDWETNDRAMVKMYPELDAIIQTNQTRSVLARLIRMRYFFILYNTNGSMRFRTLEDAHQSIFGPTTATKRQRT